jgi:hypothetical protein
MGFFSDVAEMKKAIEANLAKGHGNRSLAMASEELRQRKKMALPKPKTHHTRTFLLSALAGALWQASRRHR